MKRIWLLVLLCALSKGAFADPISDSIGSNPLGALDTFRKSLADNWSMLAQIPTKVDQVVVQLRKVKTELDISRVAADKKRTDLIATKQKIAGGQGLFVGLKTMPIYKRLGKKIDKKEQALVSLDLAVKKALETIEALNIAEPIIVNKIDAVITDLTNFLGLINNDLQQQKNNMNAC